jgi:hypothetical protein
LNQLLQLIPQLNLSLEQRNVLLKRAAENDFRFWIDIGTRIGAV